MWGVIWELRQTSGVPEEFSHFIFFGSRISNYFAFALYYFHPTFLSFKFDGKMNFFYLVPVSIAAVPGQNRNNTLHFFDKKKPIVVVLARNRSTFLAYFCVQKTAAIC